MATSAASLDVRLATLRERAATLDAEIAELRAKREQVATEVADVEALVSERGAQQQLAKRARQSDDGDGLMCARLAPCSWRHLSEVQADVASRRAAGSLIPFGAPNRVPRVYVDGCFDMMHSGHMNAVRQAKLIADSVGGVLVVGVHADAEIERNKGPPVMRDDERLALVSAVKWVDELIFDTPYSMSLPFLDSIDAEYVVHGDDISINADGTDAYAAARAAGRMKVVKRTEGVSTTDLVGRLLLLTRSHHEPKVETPKPVVGGTEAAADAAAAAAAVVAGGVGDASAPPATYTSSNISSSGVSTFLPTTWRLRQFSNGVPAARGARIVYVDGAFDLLHAGHVAALYAARNLGDFLIVGLHDDATVNAASGRNLPICSLHERALCALALGCVDEVILGAPLVVTADLIRSMNIHTVVSGEGLDGDGCDDTEPASPAAEQRHPPPEAAAEGRRPSDHEAGSAGSADRYAVPREMGILRRSERRHPLRLPQIVARIIDNRARFEARNLKREKRELNYMLTQKTYIEEL